MRLNDFRWDDDGSSNCATQQFSLQLVICRLSADISNVTNSFQETAFDKKESSQTHQKMSVKLYTQKPLVDRRSSWQV